MARDERASRAAACSRAKCTGRHRPALTLATCTEGRGARHLSARREPAAPGMAEPAPPPVHESRAGWIVLAAVAAAAAWAVGWVAGVSQAWRAMTPPVPAPDPPAVGSGPPFFLTLTWRVVSIAPPQSLTSHARLRFRATVRCARVRDCLTPAPFRWSHDTRSSAG